MNSFTHPWHATLQQTRLWIASDGRTWDSTPAAIKIECFFNLAYFPFDVQTCELQWESWDYSALQLDMQPQTEALDGRGPISLSPEFCKGTLTWQVLGVSWVNETRIYYGEPFTRMVWHVHLKRHSDWYVVNAIVPMTLTALISALAFWLHPTQSGERVGLCITTLLTVSAIHLVVTGEVPRARSPSWIDRYSSGCFIFGFTALVISVAAVYLHTVKQAPVQGRRGRMLARLQRMTTVQGLRTSMASLGSSRPLTKGCTSDQSTVEEQAGARSNGRQCLQVYRDSSAGVGSELDSGPGNGEHSRAHVAPLKSKTAMGSALPTLESREVASMIDRVCRVAFPLAFCVFVVAIGTMAGEQEIRPQLPCPGK